MVNEKSFKYKMLRKAAAILVCFSFICGVSGMIIPDAASEAVTAFNELCLPVSGSSVQPKTTDEHIRLCSLDLHGKKLYAGGIPFGIKLYTDGILISGISTVDTDKGNVSPGEAAGLKCGDIIKKINGKEAYGISSVLDAAYSSNGEPVKLLIQRGDKTLEADIVPARSKGDGGYSFGLWVRDGTAGIGTVTYIDPDSKAFGGLGHGVCDSQSGEIMPMNEGKVNEVTISGVEKGKKGDPGELQGHFSSNDTGIILSNTEYGVFGIYNSVDTSSLKLLDVGGKEELKEGHATILCTLRDNNICEYDIIIEKINDKDTETKNFIIKITDKELLENTGGIVQGMSGSPIIQNNKLVGAVTHVLVDDPTRGYGIYIENMLNAAS